MSIGHGDLGEVWGLPSCCDATGTQGKGTAPFILDRSTGPEVAYRIYPLTILTK